MVSDPCPLIGSASKIAHFRAIEPPESSRNIFLHKKNSCKVTLPYSCFIFSLFPFSPLTHMAEYQRPDGSRHQHQQEVLHAAGQPLMAQ